MCIRDRLLRGQTAVALGDELVVRGFALFLRVTQAFGERLGLADTEALLDDQVCRVELQVGLERQQRAGCLLYTSL